MNPGIAKHSSLSSIKISISSRVRGGCFGSLTGHGGFIAVRVSNFSRVSSFSETDVFGNGLIVIVKLYATVWT